MGKDRPMDDRRRNPDHDDQNDHAAEAAAADAGAPRESDGDRPEVRRAPAVTRIGHETADCRSYRPGHTVHFIQARHAAEHPDPVPVLASVDAAGAILVTDESGGLRLHNHGPARAAAALARSGGRAELVRAKSVLGVPQIRGGAMFSIAVDQRWSPCTPGPGARGARGPTGPGDSGTDAE